MESLREKIITIVCKYGILSLRFIVKTYSGLRLQGCGNYMDQSLRCGR